MASGAVLVFISFMMFYLFSNPDKQDDLLGDMTVGFATILVIVTQVTTITIPQLILWKTPSELLTHVATVSAAVHHLTLINILLVCAVLCATEVHQFSLLWYRGLTARWDTCYADVIQRIPGGPKLLEEALCAVNKRAQWYVHAGGLFDDFTYRYVRPGVSTSLGFNRAQLLGEPTPQPPAKRTTRRRRNSTSTGSS